MSSMEALLKKELSLSRVQPSGHSGGGCISQGRSYDTDRGCLYVKYNHKAEARQMFEGELASLEALHQTGTIKVPNPIKVIDQPGGGAALVMEHMNMRSLNRHSAALGEQLADLHLHNQRLREKLDRDSGIVGKGAGQAVVAHVDKFGFHAVTCCGSIPLVNDWQEDWVAFYCRQRIQPQMALLEESSGDREARELWAQLQLQVPRFFSGVEVVPALLHGDLWGGNVAELDTGPVIFDPACFYGHWEFELAIAGMFGGFGSSFYSAYHQTLPQTSGLEKRLKLYQLFHYLNHWNHFGSGYRGSSLGIMRSLLK
ncbi:ketosamine-3-kinase-like [Ranitomeya variabilis]|uniref:ketosamine-3-kinase-like n=1 Tax=Ranitomeya variabilis TaxID=490064 RepID=UPI0040568162